MTGEITYNGKGFDQFRAVHTASYVDQNDLHQPLLTVKETLDFAARVQGIGHKAGEVHTCLLCTAAEELLTHSIPITTSAYSGIAACTCWSADVQYAFKAT